MNITPNEREEAQFAALLAMAKAEDLGPGDATATLIPDDLTGEAAFTARQPMTLAGMAFLPEIAKAYDPRIETRILAEDGQAVAAGDVLARWSGPLAPLFSAERVALNFLQRLCGVATTTAAFVRAANNPNVALLDTRKTTPGWRELEKYAVRCGGGTNHRRGLYDAAMVKDNHLAGLGGIEKLADAGPALQSLREHFHNTGDGGFVELEVDTLQQLAAALTLPVDIILLDNMSNDQLREAVAMRNNAAPNILLEASGGVRLETIGRIAQTGVDRISVGALTHSAGSVDIGLDIH